MNEHEVRKTAIRKYQNGEKSISIYTELRRSKSWFFKWLKRYKSGAPNWYKDKSKAPINSPIKTSEIEKQRIIETRQRLESTKFAQIGAYAIKWELKKSGHSFPSDSTINRVLKSEGLIKKNSICPKGS